MGNMSYCRFQNTLGDLQDCFNSMSDFSSKEEWLESLSVEEQRAAKRLLILCEDIVQEFPEEEDEEEEE